MASGGILSDLLSRVTDVGLSLTGLSEAPKTPEALAGLAEDLMAGRGEATGLALGREILEGYGGFSPPERRAFLGELARRFSVDGARLSQAVADWQADPTDAKARALHAAAEPPSQDLFRTLNRVPGGTVTLVEMRSNLLAMRRDTPALAPLDDDFRHLFASWFNRGFLELRQIDWMTSAAVLEKIIAYEAVHAIQDWDDLRRRVAAPDRMLFGFFHPALPNEPLIFVEVALTQEIPAAIGPILAKGRDPVEPAKATTAVFYSISNCQTGLRGISFGSFLIKQVVEELAREAPSVRTFVTLSPVPGFRAWALEAFALSSEGTLSEEDRALVEALEAPGEAEVEHDRLRQLAARYLVEAKGRGGLPADPVARFHLGNGARLERINAEADASPRGRETAWGVMVNYLYDLDQIERNHEAFAGERAVVASSAVRRLLR